MATKKFTSAELKVMLVKAEEEEKIFLESKGKAEKVIKSLLAFNIDKTVMKTLLIEAGVIDGDNEMKMYIFQSEERQWDGAKRKTVFKIWKGRNLVELTAQAKKQWEWVKNQGKEYVIKHLTADGKAYYETEEGKKEIDGWFA